MVEGLLVLQLLGKVDAVVFADETYRSGWQQTGSGRDAHLGEYVPSGGDIALEGAIGHSCQPRQLAFADEAVVVIEIDHSIELF